MATQKREAILNAAERLFYLEGFHATGIERIVKEAGVVRMTLYNHFPSKEALVTEVLNRRHQRFLNYLDTTVQKSKAGTAALSLARAHSQWITKTSNQGCILIKAMSEYTAHAPGISSLAMNAKHDLYKRIYAALDKDSLNTSQDVADRFYLILEGSNNAVFVMGPERALKIAHSGIENLITAQKKASA